jgi:hypothetical protein
MIPRRSFGGEVHACVVGQLACLGNAVRDISAGAIYPTPATAWLIGCTGWLTAGV